jgi:hypothetical protein
MLRSLDAGEVAKISAGGREYELTPELVEIRKEEQKLAGRCAVLSQKPWCTQLRLECVLVQHYDKHYHVFCDCMKGGED